jgi:microcystin degradation protein MlrC
MRRLAVARLWHEGNSFSPTLTHLDQFRAREWVSGPQAAAFYRGTATEMGAVAEFAARNKKDWKVVWLGCAAAPPGGPVAQADYATMRDEIAAGLAADQWDAVYLSLHGALVTTGNPAPEIDLLAAVREAIGRTPLAVSFDLHANLGPPHLAFIDIAGGYKTYPHTDMAETAATLLGLLVELADGRIEPVGAIAKLDAILPSFNMRTTDGPMTELALLARAWRDRPRVLEASVFGGFAYGDTPHAGASALVYTDADLELAHHAAGQLVEAFRVRRDRFYVELPSPADGIAAALAETAGTIAVLDPADNPLSGGIADTPGLFRALIAAQPRVPAVFAAFADPDCVAAAHAGGVGALLKRSLGARLTADFGAPVPVEARVIRLTDGEFRNVGPMETGLPVSLGRTAVLEIEGVQVIVTESCQTPNDPAYFALHGIDLAATRLLCVKAKNHFRAAFAPVCRRIIDVAAPGPAAVDLRQLPFRRVPRQYSLGPGDRIQR